MASASGINVPGGKFDLGAEMDDLFANVGSVGKVPKEPLVDIHPQLDSLSTSSYGHEGMGLPDSLTSGIAIPDGGSLMDQPSGSASQPPQAGYRPYTLRAGTRVCP